MSFRFNEKINPTYIKFTKKKKKNLILKRLRKVLKLDSLTIFQKRPYKITRVLIRPRIIREQVFRITTCAICKLSPSSDRKSYEYTWNPQALQPDFNRVSVYYTQQQITTWYDAKPNPPRYTRLNWGTHLDLRGEDSTGDWWRLQNEERCGLYCTPNIVPAITQEWQMGRTRGTYERKERYMQGFSETPNGKIPTWRPRRRWEDNINPLNAELNPICHLLALLGGATIVVVSRLRVKGSSRNGMGRHGLDWSGSG